MTTTDRARKYIAALPAAVEGQGGHNATFRVAAILAKGFALGLQDALKLLQEWNEQCQPPWGETELLHKLRDAYAAPGPAGYLLEPKHRPTAAPAKPCELATLELEAHANLAARRQAEHARAQAAKRATWPAMRAPTPGEIQAIATQRQVSREAVETLASENMLTVEGGNWIIASRGRNFAQKRKLSGEPYDLGPKAGTVKAMNLAGSVNGWLHWQLEGAERVLMVEGAVGLLEAIHCVLGYAPTYGPRWGVVAATIAGSNFKSDHGARLLRQLWSRDVTIVMDNDDTGDAASDRWRDALNARPPGTAGKATCIMPPKTAKDLGDVIKRPDAHQLLTQLMNSQIPH